VTAEVPDWLAGPDAPTAPTSGVLADWLAAPQADTIVVTHPETYTVQKAAVESRHARLVARQVAAAGQNALQVQIPADVAKSINGPAPAMGRLLVGAALPVDVAIDLGGRSNKNATLGNFGAIRGNQDGGFVWTGIVEASGASAVRLHFTGFDLPEGAEMYVYGKDGQAAGPYTGRGPVGNGELYTHSIFGDQISVQLFQNGAPARLPSGLMLESVGYIGPRFLKAVIPTPETAPSSIEKAFCSYNESCVNGAACSSSNAVADARQAIASILYQSGGGYYICTGGLIADTVASATPYFLTANHCVSSNNVASSVETFFDYVTNCSGSNCTQPYNNTGDTVGATVLSASSNTDHSLLLLTGAPITADGTVAFMGWNSTPVANSNGTNLYRISHPSGAPQAYSEHDVDTGAGTCRTLPRGNFIYSNDTYGATEGGSSGSPVVDGNGRVVGQLYGACGTDVNNVCNSAANSTVDGALAAYFSSVSQWLNPGTGGPSCSSIGASCSSNSDCCSNKCRGKGGNKTCR
jgi:V8-like Glu-specific endopeptidase